jgi:NAD(P)-dependent dehydrogenase (short-subunit alcohol dehydrogenase family)
MSALTDKVVIVTGGSSGIGRAAALSFARKGAKVVITARRAAPLEETAADHPNIVGLVADVAAPDDAVRTIAKAVDTWGHLDVLVNNAGAGAILPLADATADRIMKIFAVNVLGQACSPRRRFPIWRWRRERSSMYRARTVTSRLPDCPITPPARRHWSTSLAAGRWNSPLMACVSTPSQRGRLNRAR